MNRNQLQKMPKAEFHLHLEGSLPYFLLQELDPEKYAHEPASWSPDFRFRDFLHFEHELLSQAMSWFTSPENYHRAAKEIFRYHLEHNVRYLETSIASGALDFQKLNGREIFQAVRDAVPAGLDVRLFMGIHHDGYTETMGSALEECVAWPEVDGLDLHGIETNPLEDWTAPLWNKARANGKFTKAHAGEFDGPNFVRRALNELGVNRLEHGIRSAEDPELVKILAEKGTVLDICPWSNLKLGVVPSFEDHPLRLFIDAGITCTINRDDPLVFGTTLEEEYEAVQSMGFSDREIIQLARNGFEVSLAGEREKNAWLKELETFAAGL